MKSILLALLLLPVGLTAAEGDEPPATDPEEISLRLRAIAWDVQVPSTLLLRTAPEEFLPLELNTRKPTSTINYQGDPILRFYHQPESSAEATPPPPPAPWGAYDVGNSNRELLFIFTPFPTGTRGLHRIFAFEDNSSSFGAGSYRFINLSDKNLIGMLGESRFALKPQGTEIVTPDWPSDENAIPLKIALYRSNDWVPGLRTMWSFRPGFRNIVFLLDAENEARGFLRLKVISEPVRPNRSEL